VREIIALADGLTGDFRRVRDQFEALNRDLRASIMDDGSTRGEVLESLFAGADLIADSEAGRTFAAFWRLLTDPEQSSALDQAVDEVLSRGFSGSLESRERRFLLRLTRTLLDQGGMVHEVLRNLARSLKNFVQSREYLEQRRVNQVLREAQRASLALKEKVKAFEILEFTLLGRYRGSPGRPDATGPAGYAGLYRRESANRAGFWGRTGLRRLPGTWLQCQFAGARAVGNASGMHLLG
jgi:hypothetical protein